MFLVKSINSYEFIYIVCVPVIVFSQKECKRTALNLNGMRQYYQTVNAFSQQKFTYTCPVPGLVHLAVPIIEDYDKYIKIYPIIRKFILDWYIF